MNQDQLKSLVAEIQLRERQINYGNLLTADGPREKFHFTASAGGNDFYLYNIIGGYDGITSLQVAEALSGMNGDINLHINSVGGSIFEGATIYNLFANYKRGNVRSMVDGVAASAASFVAQAAKEVVIAHNGTMMVHDANGGAFGTSKEIREQADVLDLLGNTIADVYAKKTGKKAADWRKIMQSGDTWYNAAESVRVKLADRIAGDIDEEPRNSLDFSLFTPTTGAKAATIPPAFDVEGLRNALKGVFA
jgi:ATP-dependent protease ClpP protease subunit